MKGLVLLLGAWALVGCEPVDKSTGTTGENDFALTLEVADRLVHVGDQALITLKLRRVDRSNLERGMQAVVVLTTSAHGTVDLPQVVIEVADERTAEVVRNVVFTAQRPGIAEVRASFLDATALVKVLISSVNT